MTDPQDRPAHAAPAQGTLPARRTASWRTVAKGIAIAVVVVFIAAFVVQNWDGVRAGLVRLRPVDVAAATVTALVGIVASMLSWRSLVTGAGSRLSLAAASRVFFLGQLGKYVPGSVWPVVAQMELSKRYDVPRSRAAFAALAQMLVGVVTAVLVAGVCLALSPVGVLGGYWWLYLLAPLMLALLAPPVLNRCITLASRLTGGRFVVGEPLTWQTVGAAAAWALLMWGAFGVHIWVMASRLAPEPSSLLLLATGGYALASVVGILIIILPAGAGAREAVIILVFAGVLSGDDALVVALVSRFLMLGADLVGAGAAILATRRRAPITD